MSRTSIARGINGAAFYVLLLSIFVFAMPYGTVQPWHKALFVLVVCVVAGLRVTGNVMSGTFRLAEPRLLLPLLGVLCLAALQSIATPGTYAVESADPYESESFAVVFAGIVVAGEVLFFYTDTVRRLNILVGVVITVGLGSALFGAARVAFLDDAGTLSSYLTAGQGYAQFVNRNHFAFLMEMTLGLTLGLLIKGEIPERVRFAGWMSSGFLIYSIIASDSRGGIVSLMAICIFAGGAHALTGWFSPKVAARRRDEGQGVTWIKKLAATLALCAVVFSVVVLIVAFVGGDRVATRMEGLQGETEVTDSARINRRAIWDSTIELIKDRPLFGVGFGAYGATITKFDTTGGRAALRQAHNDYLELLANGGIVGLAMFVLFGVLVGIRATRNLGSDNRFRRASCFGALIGVFGVLIHSFVDFGLHILINALVFMMLIVIAAANVSRPAGRYAELASWNKTI